MKLLSENDSILVVKLREIYILLARESFYNNGLLEIYSPRSRRRFDNYKTRNYTRKSVTTTIHSVSLISRRNNVTVLKRSLRAIRF